MNHHTLILKIGMLPPGLNSSGGSGRPNSRKKGLLNMHHTEYSDLKRSWALITQNAVMNAAPEGFKGFGAGPIWMMVVRFSTSTMDRDNAWASMKPVMDGLVRAGVMVDDNETVLPWPRLVQVKVPNKDHCGLVIAIRRLTDAEANELISVKTWAKSIGHPTTGEITGGIQ